VLNLVEWYILIQWSVYCLCAAHWLEASLYCCPAVLCSCILLMSLGRCWPVHHPVVLAQAHFINMRCMEVFRGLGGGGGPSFPVGLIGGIASLNAGQWI